MRNLPPEIELAIVDKSQSEGISLIKAATQLLCLAINPQKRNTDFDEFVGTWNPQAAARFDSTLASIRAIDPEEWKR